MSVNQSQPFSSSKNVWIPPHAEGKLDRARRRQGEVKGVLEHSQEIKQAQIEKKIEKAGLTSIGKHIDLYG